MSMSSRAMNPVVHAIATLLAGSLIVNAASWFVGTNGDDQNPGTSPEKPFATIQHAVNLMNPGDTCYIRGGVYHEAVNLGGKAGAPGNPMILTSYQKEKVTLDGTMKIDGEWTLDEGDIYKTTVKQDVTQMFVDGKLMTLARFPNALAFSDSVWHRSAARCSKGKGSTNERGKGHVIDGGGEEKGIANTGISFNGCVVMLNFGAHATGSRIVENHAKGSGEFDYRPELRKYKTTHGYFFEGGVGNAERRMLDIAEEWAYDESTKTLYLWPDDGKNPTNREIRGKVQTHAITGDAATKHIVIDGLNFFATTFSFVKSDDISIKNCDFNYYACSKRSLGVLGPSETAQFIGGADDFCSNITIYNCEFKHADASALVGDFVENMRIENNLFQQIDYACVNNDTGAGKPFEPSSTINLGKVQDLVYRRNTLSVNGNAQSFSANRLLDRPMRKFKPGEYDPTAIRPILCEYNFHTRCGLLHTDGTSMYMPLEHVKESLARYNWFIDNGQRDFRWDGDNKPLMGVHANVFRNVCMSSIRRHSPSGGDGMHLKGDYHEVYNNLSVDAASDINVPVGAGGNANSVTRNNVAQELFDHPLPGTASNNYAGQKNRKRVRDLLRDAGNWDFRPRADAKELIDQGTPVVCSVKGQSIDVTPGFKGKAPDIGAYEFGDTHYWIPGRQQAGASMPIPKDGGKDVKLDAELMYLIGLGGVRAKVHLGTNRDDLKQVEELAEPVNIVRLSGEHTLKQAATYYWRVDTERADGSLVEGPVWSFTTAPN